MADFTITSSVDFLGLLADPKRADATEGTIPAPLTWTLDNPNLGTLTPQNSNHNACNFKPAAGANGVATITVSGVDENGNAVAKAVTVAITSDTNPTTTYVVTRTH